MLTRRLNRSLNSAPSFARAFATSQTHHNPPVRSPSLGDITPDGGPAFDALSKEFRAKMAAAKEQKDRESQFHSTKKAPHVSRSVSTFPAVDPTLSVPDSKLPDVSGVTMGLGSLSINKTGKAAAESAETGKRKGGAFSSLIYGTTEGRVMDQEMETSFSQALARGKYVHSIVFHDVYPDKVDEYVEHVGKWYPRMANMPENRVNLVGSWRTEVGECDTFVHIWEYQRYTGYHASLHSISHHPEFADFDKKLKTLIRSKKTSLMQEFSFWPTTPPRKLGGVFELRSYTLHPGNLLEWETHWRRGLKARKEVMEGVGAWFVQIGDLNTVHHLWQFADLEERKVRREKSWGVEGWGETVHKTVPLIQTMTSKVLVPMPWSPVQ